MKKIILTGGGSAGHVTPNIALADKLKNSGWQIEYIGSSNGIEKDIIGKTDIPYYGIASGKLRRYFSLENFIDPFKVLYGIFQAFYTIKKIKPDIIFSKGGFVTVPVVIGGFLNKIPVVIHESDMTPGLANKISIKYAKKVCVSFPETLKYLPSEKGIYTGTPIRYEVTRGNKENGLKFSGLLSEKPILTVIGGSLGSQILNKSVREILDKLLEDFQIIHICGKGHLDKSLEDKNGYKQFEYINQELPDIFAITDIFVSRAGSNAIFEFLALKKPNLLIPLSKKASRGDQILNANSFKKQGYSEVLEEEQLNKETLYRYIKNVYENKNKYIDNMKLSPVKDSISEIINIIFSNSL